MVVREGSNVTLKCAARGSPTPTITWRRENAEPIALSSAQEGKFLNARALALVEFDEVDRKSLSISYISTMLVMSFNGSVLSISRVSRLHMGAYLCIAQVVNTHISRSLKGFDFTRTFSFLQNGIPPSVSKRVMLIVHCEYKKFSRASRFTFARERSIFSSTRREEKQWEKKNQKATKHIFLKF